jgi:hypothetical protein
MWRESYVFFFLVACSEDVRWIVVVSSLRMFMNEDVTIGVWMLAMDVTHEDNRALCDPQCHPNSIAVWDLPKCSGTAYYHPIIIPSVCHRKRLLMYDQQR